MKRLALALAAVAVLGTGCIVHNDPPHAPACARSVTVDWTFRNYTGTVDPRCANMGVDELDLYVNNAYIGTYPCAGPAVTIDGISAGTQSVRVDAIDLNNHLGLGANRIAYRDLFTLDTNACGDHPVLSEAAEARVNLDYVVDAAPPCANGPCVVYYQVTDQITGTVAANYAQYAAVGYPNDVVVFLPLGSFKIDFMQVVSGGLAEKGSRTTPTFSVARPGGGVPNPQLVPATPLLLD